MGNHTLILYVFIIHCQVLKSLRKHMELPRSLFSLSWCHAKFSLCHCVTCPFLSFFGMTLTVELVFYYLRIVFLNYPIIPNRSTGCLDKSPGGGYIIFREPGATVTNMIYKRNWSSKLGGCFY